MYIYIFTITFKENKIEYNTIEQNRLGIIFGMKIGIRVFFGIFVIKEEIQKKKKIECKILKLNFDNYFKKNLKLNDTLHNIAFKMQKR